VLHVRRDEAAIRRSHETRGETSAKNLNMSLADAVASRIRWAEWQREAWCGPSVSFNVASLADAGRANHYVHKKRATPPQPRAKRRALPNKRNG